MKALTSNYCKQQGFSLLEALVGLVLFAIIFLGSAVALKQLSGAQAQINISLIITNTLQARLQQALTHTEEGDVCSVIDSNSFDLGGKTYHIVCVTEMVAVGSAGTEVKWPVLIASEDVADAQSCADGTLKDSCYIVGR